MDKRQETYQKREFWIRENVKYVKPHFRLEKVARLVNKIAGRREVDLLDVGCGPAALRGLLSKNIHYYGIDIAIHGSDPELLERDFLESPIEFKGRRFDIIVAQGVFEYAGRRQSGKFQEIAQLLKDGGIFIASYVNFDHISCDVYSLYNNIQGFHEFHKSLAEVFSVDRVVPTSHHWHHREPTRWLAKAVEMHVNVRIRGVSRFFAVEYLFVCSALHCSGHDIS